jgi:molecular chaperone GrpE
MDYASENPTDKPSGARGEPGSTDAYARGATDDATGATADTADNEGGSATRDDSQRAVEEQRDRYLRLAADYDNYRKRSAKERAEAGGRAQADLVKQLVDALDDLARFAHVDPATVDAGTVVQGAEMVEKKLLKVLGAAGLQSINPVDQTFDPAQHEAVGTEPALSAEDDHVIARVYQQGYLFNGQLLRPARVVVKQWNG